MYLFTLVALASTATLSVARVLPRSIRSGVVHTPLKLSAPLQVRFYEEEESTPYENIPYRKNRNLPVFLLRTLKYPKLHEHQISDSPKLSFRPKYPKNKRLRSQLQYDSMFDQNGMLVLTKKRDTEDRKLNTILNKVVKYKMDERKHKYLRKPLTSAFKQDELNRLRTLVDSMNAKDDDTTMPQTVFDFNNLVI